MIVTSDLGWAGSIKINKRDPLLSQVRHSNFISRRNTVKRATTHTCALAGRSKTLWTDIFRILSALSSPLTTSVLSKMFRCRLIACQSFMISLLRNLNSFIKIRHHRKWTNRFLRYLVSSFDLKIQLLTVHWFHSHSLCFTNWVSA